MIGIALILLASFVITYASIAETINVKDVNNITVAFGSCTDLFRPQTIMTRTMQSIIRTKPDVWIWTGDAVYLDGNTLFEGSLPGPEYDIKDSAYVRNMFSRLKSDPTYTNLRKNMPVIGTWDDHDYAYDNMDKTFPYKQRNMQIFLDFLDVPANSPRRQQQGVYTSYYIGANKLIKVILLDVRYNRSPKSVLSNFFGFDLNFSFDDMLGTEQWNWLEEQLADPTPLYTLLISGTQYIPDDRPFVDNWYSDSKKKLFDLIVKLKKSGVVLISGDVHYAEVMKHPCPERVGYQNLYEFTSSGMTHYTELGDIIDNWAFSDKFNTVNDRYFGINFGLIRLINANNGRAPDLAFEARDGQGKVVLSRIVPYNDLIFRKDRVKNDKFCSRKK